MDLISGALQYGMCCKYNGHKHTWTKHMYGCDSRDDSYNCTNIALNVEESNAGKFAVNM